VGTVLPLPGKPEPYRELLRSDNHTAKFVSAMTQPLVLFRRQATSLLRDYAELIKLRVTTLIVMTAWCGYYFGAQKAGASWFSWGLFHALFGIALVSSGTAALNEVMEHDVDGHMRRTAQRPLPAGRMSLRHAAAVGLITTLGGSLYLAVFSNPLTGLLTFLTSVVYLAAYTPLKRISPICTFVGAFPGAMPGVLGWTAARNQLEWGTLILFAILFVWQFPHFFSIAWLYREDYAQGGIRMLPVVEQDGRSTARRIVAYSLILIPLSVLPSIFGMAGRIYLVGAVVLSLGLFYFGARLAFLHLPLNSPRSKMLARHVLQATVVYLPLLFALMMGNATRP
jgi:heme o synthase